MMARVTSSDAKGGAPVPTGGDPGMQLPAEQQRAWSAYMKIYLRLTYEMNRQLQAESDLSLSDYHLLNALRHAPGRRMRVRPLAAKIGWERSRVSHQVRRMVGRGLVARALADDDRRATEVTLTPQGRRAIRDATEGHAELVEQLFFAGLPADLLGPLTTALESIYETILAQGTLPRPEA
jgi:DNA-binding MarR family transcriptional regulator